MNIATQRIPLLAALLAVMAGTALAAGADGVPSLIGNWRNPASPAPYAITAKGVAGITRRNCDGPAKQQMSQQDGAQWLARISELQEYNALPDVAIKSARRDVLAGKTYPSLEIQCGEANSYSVLIAADTLLVLSCESGDCDLSRHVRAR